MPLRFRLRLWHLVPMLLVRALPALVALALLQPACTSRRGSGGGGGGGGGDDDSAAGDDDAADDDTTPQGNDDDSTPPGDDDDSTPPGDDDSTPPGDDDTSQGDDDTSQGDDDTSSGSTWTGPMTGVVSLATFGDFPCEGTGTLSGTLSSVSGTLSCTMAMLPGPCDIVVSGEAVDGSAVPVTPSCFPLTATMQLQNSAGDIDVTIAGNGTDATLGTFYFALDGVLSP